MDRAIESFVNYQKDTEERIQKWEDERWKKEVELDEKRLKENREHEVALFQMMEQMLKPRDSYHSHRKNFVDYDVGMLLEITTFPCS